MHPASLLLCLCVAQDLPTWPPATLERAGASRSAWDTALAAVEEELRPGLAHLLAAMPSADLEALSPGRIIEEVRLASKTRAEVPWGATLSDELFFEHVLPYAHVTEARDPWREDLTALCLPLIAGCTRPGEAAQRLNEQLFQKLKVRYSTGRKRADQSPRESIEQGLASCTGLSILLADACRSVCVPARLAGTADWAEKDGNHTWVEVWDEGWHFTGACEPDARGLDHAWFEADASRARQGDPLQGIWAVSWSAATPFVMAWARDARIGGVEVTERYLQDEKPVLDPSKARLLIVLRDVPGGQRIEERVRVSRASGGAQFEEGTTRGESADTNDILEFVVERGFDYVIQVPDGSGNWSFPWFARVDRDQAVVRFERDLWSVESFAISGDPTEAVAVWFERAASDPTLVFPEEVLLGRDESGVRPCIVEAWRRSKLHEALHLDAIKSQVRSADRSAPYALRAVGDRPPGGWPLVIAMHGGGGVPKEVNDQQWLSMQSYYKDHPEVSGYLYCALRAPNDDWDGFYDDAIVPLVERLITQLHLTQGVDTDRVFITGASHGGYGAFVIGPKAPWRFAAIHASASAPTPERTIARNLRNTPFSFMVGKEDTAYGRYERCVGFQAELQALKAASPSAYPFEAMILDKTGHFVPDKDILVNMLPRRREVSPAHLVWKLSDARLLHFSWLEVEEAVAGAELEASREGNRVTVSGKGLPGVWLHLDRSLFDPSESVTIVVGDKETLIDLELDPDALARHLLAVGDPSLACDTAHWVTLTE